MGLFLGSFVDNYDVSPEGTRIGAVAFADVPSLEFTLSTHGDARSVKHALRRITPYSTSQSGDLGTALRLAGSRCFTSAAGDRAGVPNLAVIVTAPETPVAAQQNAAVQESALLQSVGIHVVPVGVDAFGRHRDFLRRLSSSPRQENATFFTVRRFDALSGIHRDITQRNCVLGSTPDGGGGSGGSY